MLFFRMLSIYFHSLYGIEMVMSVSSDFGVGETRGWGVGVVIIATTGLGVRGLGFC